MNCGPVHFNDVVVVSCYSVSRTNINVVQRDNTVADTTMVALLHISITDDTHDSSVDFNLTSPFTMSRQRLTLRNVHIL